MTTSELTVSHPSSFGPGLGADLQEQEFRFNPNAPEFRPGTPQEAAWHPPAFPCAVSVVIPADVYAAAWVAPWPGLLSQAGAQAALLQVLVTVLPTGAPVTMGQEGPGDVAEDEGEEDEEGLLRGAPEEETPLALARDARGPWAYLARAGAAADFGSSGSASEADSDEQAPPSVVSAGEQIEAEESWSQLVEFLSSPGWSLPGNGARPPRGMSREAIERTTATLVHGCAEDCGDPLEKHTVGDQCAICLEEFQAGEVLRLLPCLHRYHCGCVDRWLSKAHCPECPLCRRRISAHCL